VGSSLRRLPPGLLPWSCLVLLCARLTGLRLLLLPLLCARLTGLRLLLLPLLCARLAGLRLLLLTLLCASLTCLRLLLLTLLRASLAGLRLLLTLRLLPLARLLPLLLMPQGVGLAYAFGVAPLAGRGVRVSASARLRGACAEFSGALGGGDVRPAVVDGCAEFTVGARGIEMP